MDKTNAILKKAYQENTPSDELETELSELPKDELIDFILWQFNRGFIETAKKD